MHVAGYQRLGQCLKYQPAQTLQCRRSHAKSSRRHGNVAVTAHRVDINVQGRTEVLEVAEDQTILEVALEQGLELSHDCKMGVCMTCPAKLVRFADKEHCVSHSVALVKSGCCSRFQAKLISQLACWLKRFKTKAMLCFV